ncbi:LacI family DNA-binding transcriptional regulator [Paracoccus benzoatiresistens]|uniref:LacI family DNA-binding transcriptional regulator n=1 Tax=Paracoccus benzoatiresistens TaxID=2997341 RepID=A0ABT4J7B0_9RHOB|nr:LacI family DNA-binding transcriptional regulator [Paracoccus sp. EF6]MCZ0962540.1 LacI family DNA-binding transcriptional regulator [Paracoccus sp. EF6]
MAAVTIKDVAAEAGVSIATVSNAFSGRKFVSPEVVRRVEEAARTLGYQKNIAASQLRTGRVKVVGVLVPSLADTFFAALVSDLEKLAEADGYQVLVATSGDDAAREAAQLGALLGWKPSGLIAVPCTNAIPDTLRREMVALPVVLVDRIGEEDLPVDTVVVDNHAAGREAAQHVLEKGHREILIAASVAGLRPIAERIRGITDACLAAGVAPRIVELGTDVEEGAARLGAFLAREGHPTAVIATTNVTTLATLTAFAQAGIDMPADVSLVGFDDYAWMTARRVPLSAVRQPISDIAQSAWSCLMTRIGGSADAAVRIVLDAPLQRRNSVGVSRRVLDTA